MPATTYDIDAIAAAGGKVLSLAHGDTVFARGEPGDCAYIVTHGRVRLGSAAPVEMIRPGEIFGEASLFDGEPRCASATAVGPTEVRVIDRALFHALIRDDGDFASAVLRLMTRRLRSAAVAIDRLAGDSRPELRLVAGGQG